MGLKINPMQSQNKFRPASESEKNVAKAIGGSLYTIGYALLHWEMEHPNSKTSIALTQAGENIDKFGRLGHLITTLMNGFNDAVYQTVGHNLPRAELINFIDIVTMLPFLVAGTVGLSRIFKTENLARLYGTEAVKGNPSHVIIAPNCEILEDIVRAGTDSGRIKNTKSNEVVGLHADNSIPLGVLPVNKQKGLIGHHFSAENLLDNPESERNKTLIKDSGLDRASELTFYCLPNIYMSDKDVEFSAEKVRPFLESLGDDLNGKTINIIMPEIETKYDRSVRRELSRLQDDLAYKQIKFKLNFYTPEKAFERVVEKKVIEFASSSKEKPINILHIEQSQEDYFSGEDKELLAEHEQIFVSQYNHIRNIVGKLREVPDINDTRPVIVNTVSLSMEDIEKNIRRLAKLNSKLEEAQLVVVSAFSDNEVVEMVRELIDDVPDLKRRLLVIVDKSKTAKELWDPENNLLVETFNPLKSVIADFANQRTANYEK